MAARTHEQLVEDLAAEAALLHRLAEATKDLADYVYERVPYSDGDLQRLLRIAGDIAAEARARVYEPLEAE